MSLNQEHLKILNEKEHDIFRAAHPKSFELHTRAKASLLNGVPMMWQTKLQGGFPVFVERGDGARFWCVDGHEYVDFCLGDTGAMSGHNPAPTSRVVSEQIRRGVTFMLPHEDALWVSQHLTQRYNSPRVDAARHVSQWQFAMTATDANRFALRLSRQITRRNKIIVFNYCYHGTVSETLATLQPDGTTGTRAGNIGPAVPPATTTKVVEFNDVPALEAALRDGDVACVLAEPAMTNIGIVLPDDGYHAALRSLTRRYGTLLIIDETHTISAGWGGMTRRDALEPDMIVIGKPIAGGVPAAVYGFTREVAEHIRVALPRDEADTGGVGGTLTANVLATRAMRATLEEVLTEQAYARMLKLGDIMARDIQAVIDEYKVPMIVKQLGCRVEYWPGKHAPRNGGEAARFASIDLDTFFHVFAINRGVFITPFHNMVLLCPASTEADVRLHTRLFRDSVRSLLNLAPAADALPLLTAKKPAKL